MKKKQFLTSLAFIITTFFSFGQGGWTVTNTPAFSNRVDDLFMVNAQTGYAVCGDGKIAKTVDGGNNWIQLLSDSTVYCRSVEFISTQKGFVGSFPLTGANNVLRRTVDGGTTWTDLSSLLDPRTLKGICGLAVADSNTIYGCGNWYQDTAYIVKSTDGGATWNYMDMGSYAGSLIDMYFINKDTGFATGRGLPPLKSAVILYTTNGGLNWTYKFQNTTSNELCWKIQHLTNKLYFASIQDLTSGPSNILKSTDGGMSWSMHQVSTDYNIEGVGFIDSLKGWTGGGFFTSFESNDGGVTWDSTNICLAMPVFLR